MLDLMVAERLRDAAIVVRNEGWKWIEVAPDFAYGQVFGLRQLRGDAVPLTDAQQAEHDVIHAELAEIDADGALRIERGYVRPEDELPIEPEQSGETQDEDSGYDQQSTSARAATDDGTASEEVETAAEREEDEGLKPIPDRSTMPGSGPTSIDTSQGCARSGRRTNADPGHRRPGKATWTPGLPPGDGAAARRGLDGEPQTRVTGIWRKEGLKVPQRQPKRGRLWLDDGSCIALGRDLVVVLTYL